MKNRQTLTLVINHLCVSGFILEYKEHEEKKVIAITHKDDPETTFTLLDKSEMPTQPLSPHQGTTYTFRELTHLFDEDKSLKALRALCKEETLRSLVATYEINP